MTETAMMQLLAVVVGGLLATGGGIITSVYLERDKQRRESRNLAMAFKGEISALLQHIDERHYFKRFEQVIAEIEAENKPFLMPFRVRLKYDRVYDKNVERIGMLKGKLPELVPIFYTRLNSIIEDMLSMGDETYARLELEVLLRIYHDVHRIIGETVEVGRQIVQEIDEQYH
jgi:hypothetical protein